MYQRKFLAASGVSLALALAGCSTGSATGTTTTPGSGSTSPTTATSVASTTPSSTDSSSTTASAAACDKPTELSFLTFETPNLTAKYWDDAIARTNAKVACVKIKKLVAPNAGARDDYVKQLFGTTGLPDIMLAIKPAPYVATGALADFTDDELKDFQFPKSNAVDGKTYQLPTNTQPVPLVFYNKDDFKAAGIADAPKTYQEFLDDCAKLKAKGINPLVVGGGGADTWAAMYPLDALVATEVYKATPDWIMQRSDNKVKFTDPNFMKAATKLADLAKMGYIDKAGLSRTYVQDEQAFLDNKGAMYPMGSWFAGAADSKKPKFDVGVFTWPTDDGSVVLPVFTGGGLTVSSKAPNVDLAKKWALAFQLDKASLDASVKADALIIAIKGYEPPADTGPVYKAMLDVYNKALAANGVTTSFTSEAGTGSAPSGFAEKAAPGVVDVISGKKDAAAFAAYLDAEWTKAAK